MKAKILIISAVGAAAGLLYALDSNWRKQKKEATADDESGRKPAMSGNGRASKTSRANTNDSAGETEKAASMARIENGQAAHPQGEAPPAIDDQGTDQFEASQILKNIRDNAFDASDEKLALALGRPSEEIEQWLSGDGIIDGDVIMKARTLAMQRGLEAE